MRVSALHYQSNAIVNLRKNGEIFYIININSCLGLSFGG